MVKLNDAYAKLAGLSDAELDLPARFGEDPITLRGLVGMMMQHDSEHRAEIEEMVVNQRK